MTAQDGDKCQVLAPDPRGPPNYTQLYMRYSSTLSVEVLLTLFTMTSTLCPPIEQVLPQLGQDTPSLPPSGTTMVNVDDQKSSFCWLQAVMDKPEPDVEALRNVRTALDGLWASNSQYILPSAELLANGSRNRELSTPLIGEG